MIAALRNLPASASVLAGYAGSVARVGFLSLNDLDRLHFGMHPGRKYRLRRPTPAELADWSVQPDHGFEPWCIVRRADGAVEAFALQVGETLDDNDPELTAHFDSLRELE